MSLLLQGKVVLKVDHYIAETSVHARGCIAYLAGTD